MLWLKEYICYGKRIYMCDGLKNIYVMVKRVNICVMVKEYICFGLKNIYLLCLKNIYVLWLKEKNALCSFEYLYFYHNHNHHLPSCHYFFCYYGAN